MRLAKGDNPRLLDHLTVLGLFFVFFKAAITIVVKGRKAIEDYLAPLIYASSRRCTITKAFKALPDAPDRRSFERNVLKWLDLDVIEEGINRLLLAFASALRKVLRTATLAIDYTKVPFYGQKERAPETRRGSAHRGTCTSFAFATIYLVVQNKHFTLAVHFMRGQEPLHEVASDLLDRVEPLGLKIKRVMMDREFNNRWIYNEMVRRNLPFLMAIRKTSRVKPYCKGIKRYHVPFDVALPVGRLACTLYIVTRYYKGSRGKHGVEYFTYLGWRAGTSINGVDEMYRKRFGIETNYRETKSMLAKCGSVDPALRMLLFGLSLALVNYCVYLKFEYASPKTRGTNQPRDGVIDAFEVNELIQNALRDLYGCLRFIEVLRDVPPDFIELHLGQWKKGILRLDKNIQIHGEACRNH